MGRPDCGFHRKERVGSGSKLSGLRMGSLTVVANCRVVPRCLCPMSGPGVI